MQKFYKILKNIGKLIALIIIFFIKLVIFVFMIFYSSSQTGDLDILSLPLENVFESSSKDDSLDQALDSYYKEIGVDKSKSKKNLDSFEKNLDFEKALDSLENKSIDTTTVQKLKKIKNFNWLRLKKEKMQLEKLPLRVEQLKQMEFIEFNVVPSKFLVKNIVIPHIIDLRQQNAKAQVSIEKLVKLNLLLEADIQKLKFRNLDFNGYEEWKNREKKHLDQVNKLGRKERSKMLFLEAHINVHRFFDRLNRIEIDDSILVRHTIADLQNHRLFLGREKLEGLSDLSGNLKKKIDKINSFQEFASTFDYFRFMKKDDN